MQWSNLPPCMWLLCMQAFHAKSGKAYLFARAANVTAGPSEERMLTTGMHVVCDVFCSKCLSSVGWRYVSMAATTVCAWQLGNSARNGSMERAGAHMPRLRAAPLSMRAVLWCGCIPVCAEGRCGRVLHVLVPGHESRPARPRGGTRSAAASILPPVCHGAADAGACI